MNQEDIKKDIFVQLSFSLHGVLAALNKDQKMMSKTMGFVHNNSGEFYLIVRSNQEITQIDLDQPVIFTVIKESATVSEMSEIRITGTMILINKNSDQEREIKKLLLSKSPYLGTIPFVNESAKFSLFCLNPLNIFYQRLQDEREGKPPYILTH